jgi:ketosteroid isomerase-like protein
MVRDKHRHLFNNNRQQRKRLMGTMRNTLLLGGAISFCFQALAATPPLDEARDAAQIRALIQGTTTAYAKLDPVGAMAAYEQSPSLVLFDVMLPVEQHGYANSLNVTRQVMAGASGPIVMDYQNPTVVVDGDHAYSWAVVHMVAQMKSGAKTDMLVRNSDVWARMNGKWLIVFEHNSVPLDPAVAAAAINMRAAGPVKAPNEGP